MKLLAMDCSTEACSVALLDNGQIIAEEFELAARQHTQRLLPMVDKLLAASETSLNQLDAIAFGRGPGSFTGLRICLGAVQGLAFGADLPVIAVSTLAALAQTGVMSGVVPAGATVLSTLDARMDEIYSAVYTEAGGLVVASGAEQLCSPELLRLPVSSADYPCVVLGSGWNYAERIAAAATVVCHDTQLLPRAAAVGMLAPREPLLRADQAIPRYLRDQVAWKKQPLP